MLIFVQLLIFLKKIIFNYLFDDVKSGCDIIDSRPQASDSEDTQDV